MFRIVRKSRERLIEEGYQAQLAERERLIQVLVEQIEHLRSQLNTPSQGIRFAASTPIVPSAVPVEMPPPPVEAGAPISAEEDEIQAMLQAEVISLDEARVMREALEQRKNIIE